MDPVFWEMVKAFGPWCIPTVLLWILIREQRTELSKDREQNAKNLEAERVQNAVNLKAERTQNAEDLKIDREQQGTNFNAMLTRHDAHLVRHWTELGRLKDAFEMAKCRLPVGGCPYQVPKSTGIISERG